MAKYLDENGLLYLWGKLKNLFVPQESGKGLSTNDYTTGEKEKLAGIATGANKYTHPSYTAKSSGLYKVTVDSTGHVSGAAAVSKSDITGLGIPAQDTTYQEMTGASSSTAGAAGLVPAPASGEQAKYLRGDGTWGTPTNTTYSNMTGATSSAAGKAGLVPAPAAGKHTSFLRGDGTWVIPTDTKYSVATSSANGLMSSGDKAKLDGFSAASAYALKTDLASVYKYKGSKATYSALPSSGNTAGDVWNVESDGMNYAWTGSAWDALGAAFAVETIANADIDSILAS